MNSILESSVRSSTQSLEEKINNAKFAEKKRAEAMQELDKLKNLVPSASKPTSSESSNTSIDLSNAPQKQPWSLKKKVLYFVRIICIIGVIALIVSIFTLTTWSADSQALAVAGSLFLGAITVIPIGYAIEKS